LLRVALCLGERLQLMHQTLGVDPTQGVLADIELPGVNGNRCDGSTYEFNARVVMMPTVVVDGGRGDGRHGAGRKLVWRCGSRWRSPPTVVRG
jgi:hypothetical protein